MSKSYTKKGFFSSYSTTRAGCNTCKRNSQCMNTVLQKMNRNWKLLLSEINKNEVNYLKASFFVLNVLKLYIAVFLMITWHLFCWNLHFTFNCCNTANIEIRTCDFYFNNNITKQSNNDIPVSIFLRPEILIKKSIWRRCFSGNFKKILITLFL